MFSLPLFTSFSLMWQGARSGTSTPKEETKSVTALKQILNEKETKILQLETEIVRVSAAQFQQSFCCLVDTSLKGKSCKAAEFRNLSVNFPWALSDMFWHVLYDGVFHHCMQVILFLVHIQDAIDGQICLQSNLIEPAVYKVLCLEAPFLWFSLWKE